MLDSQTPDKLNEELDRILKPYRNLHCVYCGHKSFSVQFDEAKRAITTAYVEAIRSAVPEKIAEDEPHGSLDGMTEAEIFNQAIDTFTKNLKNQGLLPNGKDGDE